MCDGFRTLVTFFITIFSILKRVTELPVLYCLFKVMLSEVLQVLRGAGKVGSALVTTQGEQLRLMACNSSLGAGIKAVQDVANELMGTFMDGTSQVSFTDNYVDRVYKYLAKSNPTVFSNSR